MNKLEKFFTPIVYDTADKTWEQRFIETVDDCYYMGGRRFHVQGGRARVIDEPALTAAQKCRRIVQCYFLLPYYITIIFAAKLALNPRGILTGLDANAEEAPKSSEPIRKKRQMSSSYVVEDDLKLLENGQQLNDACINTFFETLVAKSENCLIASSYLLSNAFKVDSPYSLFRKSDRSNPESLYQEKLPIFLPLNVGCVHWALLAIDCAQRKLRYYDSLSIRPGTDVANVKELLQWFAAKENVSLTSKDWQVEIAECPKQTNGSDCGVFTCMAAERLMQDLPLDFSANDVPLAREKMLAELQKRIR